MTPTIRMRAAAERLRELRISKDMTVESVAKDLLVSASKDLAHRNGQSTRVTT